MATLIEIRMPEPAPDIDEVDVVAWLVEPGAEVEQGDPILEVETEKSTLEIEAPARGTLAEIVVQAGALGVAVGTVLGRIEASASPTEDVEAPEENQAAAAACEEDTPDPPKAEAETQAPPTASVPEAPGPGASVPPAGSTALARRIAERSGLSLRDLPGTGAHGRILRTDVERQLAGATGAGGAPPVRLEADCDAGDLVAILGEFAEDAEVGAIPLETFLLRAASAGLRAVSGASERVSVCLARADAPDRPCRVEDADLRGLASLAQELRQDPSEATGEIDLLLEHLDVEGIDRHWPALPQRARFSVGVAAPRPRAVIRDGQVQAGQGLGLTLYAASESQALEAARLLAHLRRLIENPLEMTL